MTKPKATKAPYKGEIILVRKHGLVLEDETEFPAVVTRVIEVDANPDTDKPKTFDVWATWFPPNGYTSERGVIPHQADLNRDGTARWRHIDEDFIEQPYEFNGEDSPRSADSEDKGYDAQREVQGKGP